AKWWYVPDTTPWGIDLSFSCLTADFKSLFLDIDAVLQLLDVNALHFHRQVSNQTLLCQGLISVQLQFCLAVFGDSSSDRGSLGHGRALQASSTLLFVGRRG